MTINILGLSTLFVFWNVIEKCCDVAAWSAKKTTEVNLEK